MDPIPSQRTPLLPEESDEEACLFAMQLASYATLPMTLKAVVELDVLEIMARHGPNAQLSACEIVRDLETNNPNAPVMLDRMLRLLASYGVLTCTVVADDGGGNERKYGLSRVCKFLTKNKDGVSMAPMALMNHDKVLMESWYHLKDAVLDGGIPFNKAHGMSAFEYPSKDLRFNKIFNQGMSNHSTLAMNKILDKYKGFEGLEEIVDVGGGTGATLRLIISKYPNIKGVNFDLPHVIADAPSFNGIEHVGGDMFSSVPSGANIFMKWILHDWSDEHCVKLLENCWKSLPESGKVIVVDALLPNGADCTLVARRSFHSDMAMLAYNPGGKERTQEEMISLSKKAGFSGFQTVCRVLNIWVMEFTK